jgi:hypothetical protein
MISATLDLKQRDIPKSLKVVGVEVLSHPSLHGPTDLPVQVPAGYSTMRAPAWSPFTSTLQ